jgi:hypothetical protein
MFLILLDCLHLYNNVVDSWKYVVALIDHEIHLPYHRNFIGSYFNN